MAEPKQAEPDPQDPFGPGWLTEHLDHVVSELAARPPSQRPALTGARAGTKSPALRP